MLSTSSIASKRKPRKQTSGTSISPQGASANFSADDETIGEPITNIFEALFDDPVEAARLTLLADMSIAIERHIKQQGWTQKEAAAHLGVTQPRISNLMRGRLDLFSLDSLAAMLALAGIQIELNFKDAA